MFGKPLSNPERLAALESTRLMDSAPEPAFDRLTRLAAQATSSPVCLISLVDERRQFFKSCIGLPEPWAARRQTPLTHSFCKHAVESGDTLIVEDARADAVFKSNRAVDELGVVAYLGVPIASPEGEILGSFCVIDGRPRQWTDKEIESVRELTLCAQTEIRLRRLLQQQDLQISKLEVSGAELHERVEVADLISRRKSEFLAQLGHELRNPLSPLLCGIQLLCDGDVTDDELPDLYQLLGEQARQMKRLVDDMLDLSRVEQGKIRINREPVDFMKVIRLSLSAVREEAQERGHSIDLRLPSGSLLVSGDGDRLVQVVNNLLTNACRYTPRGGTIRVIGDVDAGDFVLTIRDNGVGIPVEALPGVFDVFRQAGNSSGQEKHGLGIGLALVKQLVEMHAGRIFVESDGIGRGSQFTLRLPLASTCPAPAAQVLSGVENEIVAGATGSGTPLDILVVEDTRAIAKMFQRLLEILGHRVRVGYDVAEAWEHIDEVVPQLIFSDLDMPGTDGYEFAERLKADTRTRAVPLIAMTGKAGINDQRRVLAAGFDHHLLKPIDKRAVSNVLADCVSH